MAQSGTDSVRLDVVILMQLVEKRLFTEGHLSKDCFRKFSA